MFADGWYRDLGTDRTDRTDRTARIAPRDETTPSTAIELNWTDGTGWLIGSVRASAKPMNHINESDASFEVPPSPTKRYDMRDNPSRPEDPLKTHQTEGVGSAVPTLLTLQCFAVTSTRRLRRVVLSPIFLLIVQLLVLLAWPWRLTRTHRS